MTDRNAFQHAVRITVDQIEDDIVVLDFNGSIVELGIEVFGELSLQEGDIFTLAPLDKSEVLARGHERIERLKSISGAGDNGTDEDGFMDL